ncbi:MAG: aromatic ring-hydroxylating dioxygenase subunit alpha [Phenylobacterium sp.]|uniref:aromatic ring-hydroxylating dioxygenase subunit alpha n=1 Tax=Phenylobacterium sp. TaxID=1871053 RepID=UPI00121115EB|nr:aromatic ring-hydroxylating dioxygenase subunit alpha [Phenylobacterium sp.]TAJ69813.1 MAG: aromatic ring-hydroxylating dioxygenase subunit alpha [Phenylobacterium sp.]
MRVQMREGERARSSRLADHTTPFVRSEWYVAGLSGEIGRQLTARKLLGVEVLLYRREDGTPVALRNRCPHRSFPLSHGKLEGDVVVCGYHGLAFGADGACVRIPSQALVPSAVRAQNFPVVERAPLVWIWMGDPDQADPGAIPEHPWLHAPDYTHVGGYLHVKCNYIRLHENVLDLTHFPFLHGEAVGDLAYAQAPFEVAEAGASVRITRRLEDHPVNAGYGSAIGNLGHRVNRTSESWFKTPAFHVAHATIEDLEGGVGGRAEFHFKILHMFTPETATSTHYFWASARDVAIKDEALSEASRTRAVNTFLEDVEALERIEAIWSSEPDDFHEISVTGDRAGLLMRRIIARRAAEEA